jgi:DNA-binding NtrC family response regulator
LPTDIGKKSPDTTLSAPQITKEGIDMNRAIMNIEREMIQQAMVLGQGVKTRAAALLNINRTTLVEKIKRLRTKN